MSELLSYGGADLGLPATASPAMPWNGCTAFAQMGERWWMSAAEAARSLLEKGVTR